MNQNTLKVHSDNEKMTIAIKTLDEKLYVTPSTISKALRNREVILG